MIVAMYLAAAVAANLSVTAFGPSVSIINAFVLIAFDLTARDTLHERWQGRGLRWRMITLIGAGAIISAVLNGDAAQIALASFAAFAVSGFADTVTYSLIGNRARLLRINGSNVVSAAADSLVFPLVAFGLPLLWPIVIGQFMAKLAGGFLWSLVLIKFRRTPLLEARQESML